MLDFKEFEKQRRVRQFIASAAFVFILAVGWFFPLLGYFLPVCMVLGVAIAVRRGRKWCDWYCPRGSFWDYCLKPFSPNTSIPAFLKAPATRISLVVILMGFMLFQIIRLWPSAYKIGRLFIAMVTFTTLAGILLALFFHRRSWCYICPVGTLASWVGKEKAPLSIRSSRCVECRLCAKHCPMQLSPYRYKKEGVQQVTAADCLKCGVCVHVCPKQALYF